MTVLFFFFFFLLFSQNPHTVRTYFLSDSIHILSGSRPWCIEIAPSLIKLIHQRHAPCVGHKVQYCRLRHSTQNQHLKHLERISMCWDDFKIGIPHNSFCRWGMASSWTNKNALVSRILSKVLHLASNLTKKKHCALSHGLLPLAPQGPKLP